MRRRRRQKPAQVTIQPVWEHSECNSGGNCVGRDTAGRVYEVVNVGSGLFKLLEWPMPPPLDPRTPPPKRRKRRRKVT